MRWTTRLSFVLTRSGLWLALLCNGCVRTAELHRATTNALMARAWLLVSLASLAFAGPAFATWTLPLPTHAYLPAFVLGCIASGLVLARAGFGFRMLAVPLCLTHGVLLLLSSGALLPW